jgi:hypothetical protein
MVVDNCVSIKLCITYLSLLVNCIISYQDTVMNGIIINVWLSEWLLLNAKCAIFQLYHGGQRKSHIWDKEKVVLQDGWHLKRVWIHMKFSMTGQDKSYLSVQVTSMTKLPPIHNVSTIVDFNLICATMYYLFKFACQLYNFISRYSNESS